ncbi:MAG TPA: hypothetical protein VFV87_18550 [Pirellulaceae bacterium]|nr:hypothetical protein [Pirellulaceae bacterium]
MGSTAGAIGRWRTGRIGIGPLALRQALGLTALGLLVFLAVLFCTRRLSGALAVPLGGAGLIAAAVAVGGLAAVGRVLALAARRGSALPKTSSTEYSVLSTQYLAANPGEHPFHASLLRLAAHVVVPSLAATVFLASLTSREAPAWAVAIAWFLLVASEGTSWLVLSRRRSAARARSRWETEQTPVAEPDESIPANIVQQLTRTREGEGEALHALVRARIPAGDTQAVVHLAFCPPLASPPELTAHAIDADDIAVRITTAETYGLRLEVRSAAKASADKSVLVEVIGRAGVTS